MLKNDDFLTKLGTLLADIEWKKDEPMAKHTSFRIGGPAYRVSIFVASHWILP